MRLPYTALIDLSDFDMAIAARKGVWEGPAAVLAGDLGLPEPELRGALGLEEDTAEADGLAATLPPGASERVIGLARLIGILERLSQALSEPGPMDARERSL